MTRPVVSRRKTRLYTAMGLAAILFGLAGRSFLGTAIADDPAVSAPLPRPGGSLLICGGGPTPDELRARFLQLAGGSKARIVVIPTAHAAADSDRADAIYLDPWRALGADVTLFHTRSRDQANDPEFLRTLAAATGVWISGGVQTNLTRAYGDTEVERLLKAILDRGGVVAGTSAGAAIMTRVMIAGGRRKAVEGQGFDLFPNAVVDQHFLKRKRMDRLMSLLSNHPELLGFGIDESTALLVQGTHLSVLGDSYVVACLPETEGHPARTEFLKRGDETEFQALRDAEPRITSTVDLDEAIATVE